MTEETTFSQDEMNTALFAQLVMSLANSAMIQLGKMVNPATKKAEVDLQGAQMTIDMLVMLDARTKGNLTPEEQTLLRESLKALQLNYVETAQATPAPPAPSATPENKDSILGASGDAKPADKEARFHKTYS